MYMLKNNTDFIPTVSDSIFHSTGGKRFEKDNLKSMIIAIGTAAIP